MDWVVDARSPQAIQRAVTVVVDHLRRHEKSPGSADLAAATVRTAVERASSGAQALWLRLSWDAEVPTLELRRGDVGPDGGRARPAEDRILAPVDEGSLWSRESFARSRPVEIVLPVPRSEVTPVAIKDLNVHGPETEAGYQALAATLLAGPESDDSTTEELCAALGWSAGDLAGHRWAAGHDGRWPSTAEEAADAFCDFMNRAGGDFFVLEGSDRRAVVANRTCPFGPGVAGTPALCQSTSALAGSIASRSSGQALVALDETIAEGDARCRVVVDFDGAGSYGQRYLHPGSRPPGPPKRKPQGPRARFRVELSMHLPRDHQSVTLARHLISHAMNEIGVRRSDVDDVALAVTEATANVINHAEDSDEYRVTLTVGAQMAEIRVIDTGHGFDYESLTGAGPDLDSERGRGLVLMHALVDQARFISMPERGTVVHLIKNLHFDTGPAVWLHAR